MREIPGIYVQQIAIRNQLEEQRRKAAAVRRWRTAQREGRASRKEMYVKAHARSWRYRPWPARLWQVLRWGHG